MGVFTSSKVVKGREEYIIETHTLIEHLVRGALSADAGAREARRGCEADAGARCTLSVTVVQHTWCFQQAAENHQCYGGRCDNSEA